MNRVSSFLQLAEAAKGNADLPAGADPYEDFDFSPYLSSEQTEEDLRKTWRVFTKVKVRFGEQLRAMPGDGGECMCERGGGRGLHW